MDLVIKSKLNNYHVNFYNNFLSVSKLNEYDLVIIDSTVLKLYPGLARGKKTLSVTISEHNKDLNSVQSLLSQFVKFKINRDSKVICIGGGCLQDIVTLATSIYMRGIDWDFMPTTVQAMGDSCIGGKSSINFNSQKNVIGNYFPPKNIMIIAHFIQSLPEIEILSGIIEVMKINFAKDPTYFGSELVSYFTNQGYLDHKIDWQAEFNSIIHKSLKNKKYFIEIDEFDKSARKLLNFGHTFGHAIESYSEFRINHGIAVGIGMLCAFELARSFKPHVNFDFENQLVKLIKSNVEVSKFFSQKIDTLKFLEILRTDKKAHKNSIDFIIPDALGLTLFKVTDFKDLTLRLKNIISRVSIKLGVSN